MVKEKYTEVMKRLLSKIIIMIKKDNEEKKPEILSSLIHGSAQHDSNI
jgi:hypothetical protein